MTDNPRGGRSNWYRITDKSTPAQKTAEVYIYDEIGMFGKTAADFVNELKAVKADEIQLHVNSPGGDVFDAVAILNTLRGHPARVVATVDGLAASSASFVVQAADEIVMARNSEMMIHDASGLAIGNVKVMQELAARLDAASNNIASIYAERAGGTVEEWRSVMQAETWFSAQEAVDAGLADRVDEAKAADESVKARFDLSIFNHAGRADAPAPPLPSKPAAKTPTTAADAARRIHNAAVLKAANIQKEGDMQFSDEELATLRTKLGLADDAPLEPSQVLAAIADPGTAPQDKKDPPGEPVPAAGGKPVDGIVQVSQSVWDSMHDDVKRLKAKEAKRERDERDQVIDSAIQAGKFTPAQKDYFSRLWDADPKATRELIDNLAKNNAFPVSSLGHSGGPDDDGVDDEFAHLFPPMTTSKGA